MKSSIFALALAVVGASGCVIVSHHTVAAGDALDAQFELTWITTDAMTGSEIDCRSAGADMVRVTSRNTNSGDIVTDLFDCEKRAGQTDSLTAGNYFINADLVMC